jgi:hypothetical protein
MRVHARMRVCAYARMRIVCVHARKCEFVGRASVAGCLHNSCCHGPLTAPRLTLSRPSPQARAATQQRLSESTICSAPPREAALGDPSIGTNDEKATGACSPGREPRDRCSRSAAATPSTARALQLGPVLLSETRQPVSCEDCPAAQTPLVFPDPADSAVQVPHGWLRCFSKTHSQVPAFDRPHGNVLCCHC